MSALLKKSSMKKDGSISVDKSVSIRIGEGKSNHQQSIEDPSETDDRLKKNDYNNLNEEYQQKLKEDNENKEQVENSQSVISNFNIPILNTKELGEQKDNTNYNNSNILYYLNDKVKFLEAENKYLLEEVTNNHSFTEKEKINYYLRLRKDLIEENERLVSEKKVRELNHKSQIDKLNLEINALQEKLRKIKISPQEKNLEILSSQREPMKVEGVNTTPYIESSESKDVSFVAKTKYFKNIDSKKEENQGNQITQLLKEQKEKQVGPKNSIYNLNKKDHNNPFIPVIDDLEERVILLEQKVNEKDADIMELNEVISTNEQISLRGHSALQMEINKWKEKYLLILATRKTISQEFTELNAKTTKNIKASMSKQTYDMESKILHLEKMNLKLNNDMKAINSADHEITINKATQINNFKRDLKNLMDNYEDLYHNYEESLTILTKQIDSIKQLYLSRENEFINLTNYYIDTINDFSKPVTDIVSNPSNLKILEESLIHQNKQTEEMRKAAEKHIKENSMIKSENFESKAIMRQKINDAMKFYDNSIANISDNHKSIEEKLAKITGFMEVFDKKFLLFNSLIEDKKVLIDRVNHLEVKIRMLSNEDQFKEVLTLRESNIKLSKELESKVNLLKEMEEIHETIFTLQTESHFNKNIKSNSGNMNSDTFGRHKSLNKFNNEKRTTMHQINHTQKTKDISVEL